MIFPLQHHNLTVLFICCFLLHVRCITAITAPPISIMAPNRWSVFADGSIYASLEVWKLFKKECEASGFCLLCHFVFLSKKKKRVWRCWSTWIFGALVSNKYLLNWSVLMGIKIANQVLWYEKMITNLSHPPSPTNTTIHSLGLVYFMIAKCKPSILCS